MALWSITIAFVLLAIGALAFTRVGAPIKRAFGGIPFGNPTLWAAAFIIAGLMTGGIAGGKALYSNATDKLSTASVTGGASNAQTVPGVLLDSCTLATISKVTGTDNVTFRSDPNNLQREYVDVKYDSGGAVINGTLNCNRKNTADLSKGGSVQCVVKADSYKSEVSTTDYAQYYVLATTATKSQVPGYTWQQTAYLKSGGVAATSDNLEKVDLVFAQDVAQQTLGFRMNLPGRANLDLLNNQSSREINIECGGVPTYKFTVTKTTA